MMPELETHPVSRSGTSLAARLAVAAIAASMLAGCAAAIVGGVAVATVVATDKRSTGTVIDDQTIEYTVVDRLYESDRFDRNDHVKVEVYEGVVLLVGEVSDEEDRLAATRIATEVGNVERVVNELQVASAANTAARLDNTWMTTKVNTALLKENPVPGFDATRVKVVSSGSNIYLMGRVSREEGDAVAEVARNVSGVKKVVKVFSYSD